MNEVVRIVWDIHTERYIETVRGKMIETSARSEVGTRDSLGHIDMLVRWKVFATINHTHHHLAPIELGGTYDRTTLEKIDQLLRQIQFVWLLREERGKGIC